MATKAKASVAISAEASPAISARVGTGSGTPQLRGEYMSSRTIYVLSLTVVGIYALFALLTGTDEVRGFHAWPVLVSGVLILTRVVTRLRTDAQKDIQKDHRLGMVALLASLALISWGSYLLLK